MARPKIESSFRLTEAGLAILRAIDNFARKYGYPPTGVELAKSLGLAPQSVRDSIAILRRHGFVSVVSGRVRTIKINEQAIRREYLTRDIVRAMRGGPEKKKLSARLIETIEAELADNPFHL